MNADHRPNGLPQAHPVTHAPPPERSRVEPELKGDAAPAQQAAFSYENPADLLFPDPDERDRTTREYAEYRDLVLRPDIRRRGIQVPLLAHLEGLKRRVFDGGSRLEAALLERIQAVPVLTYPQPPSMRDRKIATFLANENRLDWTPAEKGRFYLQTLREEGWTQAEMCRQIPGLRPSAVSKTLKWLETLPPEFHGKVGEGDGLIPERGAYTICDFPPDQRTALCEKFIAGLLTVQLLDEMRKKMKGERKGKPKPVTFSACGIMGTITGNPLEALRALHAKLTDLFKRVERDPALAELLPSLLKG